VNIPENSSHHFPWRLNFFLTGEWGCLQVIDSALLSGV
jgi:hypothetical protein